MSFYHYSPIEKENLSINHLLYIHEFNEIIFISVPQLGNNRFSNEGYINLFEFLDDKLKPIIINHLSTIDSSL
jgi:hypothetical protein